MIIGTKRTKATAIIQMERNYYHTKKTKSVLVEVERKKHAENSKRCVDDTMNLVLDVFVRLLQDIPMEIYDRLLEIELSISELGGREPGNLI